MKKKVEIGEVGRVRLVRQVGHISLELCLKGICLFAAVVLAGCSSVDGDKAKAVGKQLWYLNGLFADDDACRCDPCKCDPCKCGMSNAASVK